MDPLAALRAEITKKRKSSASSSSTPKTSSSSAQREPPTKRWRTQADFERERERAYHARQKAAQQAKLAKRPPRPTSPLLFSRKPSGSSDAAIVSMAQKLSTSQSSDKSTIDNIPRANNPPETAPPLRKRDVMKRLRALKQPATLFGEDDWMRFRRLRDLQLNRDDQSDGQRNLYQKKMREVRAKHDEEDVYAYTRATLPTSSASHTGSNGQVTSESAVDAARCASGEASDGPNKTSDTACKEDFVQSAINKYMRLWQSDIDALSKEERRTNKGRSTLVTYEQTKQWLQPLHKLLRSRALSKTILDALRDIFDAAGDREYIRAMRLYLERLAIGNAPWPMGATQVGIHSRAAREKIGEDKIAHVMNDEQTRKYIQAVKRLLTVAQRHFPTAHSKMVST